MAITWFNCREEPDVDANEGVKAFASPGEYRITCFMDNCNWEEVLKDPDYSNAKYTDDKVEEIRYEHVEWHREGCPD